jgi:hypothetical protein
VIEDAENRLTAMETRPDVAAVLPALKQRLVFAYDGMGRRIQKSGQKGSGLNNCDF